MTVVISLESFFGKVGKAVDGIHSYTVYSALDTHFSLFTLVSTYTDLYTVLSLTMLIHSYKSTHILIYKYWNQ